MAQIKIGNITIEVVKKNVRNARLCVSAPSGTVRISAPHRVTMRRLREFVLSKLGWIEKQQVRVRKQRREPMKEYVSGESHYYLGKSYSLQVIERNAKPGAEISGDGMNLFVRPGSDRDKRQSALNEWYRQQLKVAIPPLISKWEDRLGVGVNEFGVKRMKTRWGTCNMRAKRIWINLELAKKDPEHLEYIVVHEMMHLIERKHNRVFKNLMTEYLPNWPNYRAELNRLPIS
jgi:predicted metal-dependent hydrolase